MDIFAPVAGWVTPLADVPDPVFSGRMLGDGIAIDPIEGRAVAPFDGRIVSAHPSGHAVSIVGQGVTILIHVGIDSVELGGEGFRLHVREGDSVRRGDPLIDFDLDRVSRTVPSLVTPVIVTEGALAGAPDHSRLVEAGEMLFSAVPSSAATTSGQEDVPPDLSVHERRVRVGLAHGLHARPAARVAALARAGTAKVVLKVGDGRRARADSPVSLLALALPHGADIILRGEGSDASAVLDAITAFLSADREDDGPRAATGAENESRPVDRVLRGVRASPGLALGLLFRLADQRYDPVPDGAGVAVERAALDRALADADAATASVGASEGAEAIFAAHRALLADPELRERAEADIDAGRSAAFAWQAAVEGFRALLAASGDPHLAARAADLRDIERRVLALLTGQDHRPVVPRGAIVAASDILPSDVAPLAAQGAAGIALSGGGAASHAAIIAAGLGLPMVAGLGAALGGLPDDMTVILDADAGLLRANISEEERASLARTLALRAAKRDAARARAHEPCVTADGRRIEVFANLGSLADARQAVAEGAEGCGLLRTEFLFQDADRAPARREQRALYQAIADALAGRPLIVRTLDIGADKPARWLRMAAEDNPALGLRGIRLQLARQDLLRDQLAALVGLAGDVRILLPMVTGIGELRTVRTLLAALAAETGGPVPLLGIMVETPAAALIADDLAAEADFLSIGTNDLTQYILAADRTNAAVSAIADALHPAVLRAIAATVSGGEASGRATGVCGGMAADPAALPLLIGLGVTELSVPPPYIAETKAALRLVDIETCRALARQALAAPDAATVRALLATETPR